MVHQRHGCEPAGRLHGTVTALDAALGKGKAPEAAGEPKSVSGCAYNGLYSAPESARALEHL